MSWVQKLCCEGRGWIEKALVFPTWPRMPHAPPLGGARGKVRGAVGVKKALFFQSGYLANSRGFLARLGGRIGKVGILLDLRREDCKRACFCKVVKIAKMAFFWGNVVT